MLVLDAGSGKRLEQLPIDGDVDDLWFDARSRCLLASCGAGIVDIVAVPAAGSLRIVGRVPTASGARTSLFDSGSRRIYVAVPHRGTQAAEVRIFEIAR